MPADTAIHFFLQLAVILMACRLAGLVARRIGQAQVVGEMIAGVILGPSLLGRIAPDLQGLLFPPGITNVVLYTTAQIGLVLYMFIIGLNFDVNHVKQRAGTAAAVSATGTLAPLALGGVAAIPLLAHGGFFGDGVNVGMAMMFLGASVAITAFPMLARIIFEKRLSGTSLGTLALACGATSDAISWCILAVVLAVYRNSPVMAVVAIVGGLVYTLVLLTLGRRAFAKLGDAAEARQAITAPMLSTVLIVLMACAWLTDTIGIYAIFGAFILGAAMPSGFFAERLTGRLEPLTTTFLLPLFFVYSGLNTEIGLVNTPFLWAVTAGLLVVAVVGKGVACAVAARLSRVPVRDSLALGSLMNARGLIELILLNIGLEAGVITPTLFTILVLVAIVTTLMASPIFEFVYGRHRTDETGDTTQERVPQPSA
ncbi:cation:proton antiporter [Mycolicibacterium smegmatis]|uniref:Transporter, monovalent cation:proton antiporter-2 (CPA2) family protein n=3 Tax=Mycolicibacterium smegmatis TaxID=1772 RepID=A0R739_MYCS2|nr:cation:proton antiporter [Mycolicibacterium smegmatis]ABK73900.1 transporter, monovalent cation:proton antiporter-2 (CPA2) family protein [Mycolicibacterium smegmatis MC2 155]AFP43013.1 Sodium/hydrogen exchanger [Mycolicibacterium smegmatis MC2 155]AIU11734.1 potassium transporter [Mycolicibacterium smegmatis MC2 155]AIU18359.1 potassium transporter [Mycolicibacterium smegmatis]AIU24981.1 potassium transporter [Mycolicibacterium smegmatis]